MELLIEGKLHKLDLTNRGNGKCSAPHKKARSVIKEVFPSDILLEEILLPKVNLRIDFLLISHKIAIEVHGQQHYEFNSHFYKNKIDYLKALTRDRTKIQILEDNGIQTIIFKYDEENLWKTQLQNHLQQKKI